jgi:hypothetical protein
VEDGSDGVEKTVYHVSILSLSCDGKVKDLRAEDGQAKCSCRQGTQSIVAIVGIIACVSRSTKTVETSIRSGQDCHSYEAPYEEHVEDDEQPTEEFGSAALEAEVDDQCGDGVGSCSCKNTFDCAGGVANILDHSIDLVEARGEETKGAESVISNRMEHRMHYLLT